MVKKTGSEHAAIARLEKMGPKEIHHLANVTNPKQAAWGS